MPGIGPRSGSRILAEIGGGSRFAAGDRFACYASPAPVTRQSGKSINRESKRRRSNHRPKNAMFLAAFASIRSLASKAFYHRKRADGKKRNAAHIGLGGRRCRVNLALHGPNQPYLTAAD